MTLLDLTPRPAPDALAGLPVAVIGAGPVGLAAAAELLERGVDVVVYEAGESVAHAVRQWGHTRLFSPWRFLIGPAARRLLERGGWVMPAPDRVPTGAELVRDYLAPLGAAEAIRRVVRTRTRVESVAREGMDRTRTAGRAAAPFVLRVHGVDGLAEDVLARAVIDASGTFGTPNPLGANGLPPLGLPEASDRVTGALPDVLGRDRSRFAGRRTTVVGAGHSAANTLLALLALAEEEPGTRVAWLIRTDRATRVASSPDDELADRARLGAGLDAAVRAGRLSMIDGFRIARVESAGGGLRLVGTRRGAEATHETDVVVNATGFRPDLGMLREIRLDLDDIVEAPKRLAPLIDPNEHSCGTVAPHGFRELAHPEPGFFIVGMKSYGRAPTFLLATGYEQVRSIAAYLSGDLAAAGAVALTLPATGVCSTDAVAGGCCA
jgi:glycine/D-amino acid oxidase-like deaminating enzyme